MTGQAPKFGTCAIPLKWHYRQLCGPTGTRESPAATPLPVGIPTLRVRLSVCSVPSRKPEILTFLLHLPIYPFGSALCFLYLPQYLVGAFLGKQS